MTLENFRVKDQSKNNAIFAIQNSLCDHSAIYATAVQVCRSEHSYNCTILVWWPGARILAMDQIKPFSKMCMVVLLARVFDCSDLGVALCIW